MRLFASGMYSVKQGQQRWKIIFITLLTKPKTSYILILCLFIFFSSGICICLKPVHQDTITSSKKSSQYYNTKTQAFKRPSHCSQIALQHGAKESDVTCYQWKLLWKQLSTKFGDSFLTFYSLILNVFCFVFLLIERCIYQMEKQNKT